MFGLYDRIARMDIDLPNSPEVHRLVRVFPGKSPRIVIDNVSDYYMGPGFHNYANLDKFPNIAPPFESFFMEFKPKDMSPIKHLGALFVTSDLDKGDGQYRVLSNTFVGGIPANARWKMDCVTFVEIDPYQGRSGYARPVFHMVYFIDSNGVIINSEHVIQGHTIMPEPYIDTIDDEVYFVLFPCLLAISFMHCKNVEVIDHSPPRSERRRAEKQGYPSVTFKTLNVDPMKKVLRSEGGIETNGLSRALHICRGHFAHYTEERPLFGKYSGDFFIPMHTRGKTEQGVVVKDYNVKNKREIAI